MKGTKKPKLKKNDLVVVTAGRDRGRQGKILRVFPSRGASSSSGST
jgi:ribosomal protein L24